MDRIRKVLPARLQSSHPKVQESDEKDGGSRPASSIGISSEKAVEASSPAPPKLTQEDEYIHGFKLFIVLLAVSLVAFLILLDTSILTTAIPRITDQFHSVDDVGWYGSSYLLASCALQPLTGKLYSYLHAKWTFLTFIAIFELGSLLCGVANSSKMLIVARAIAGLGSSGILNGALTIVANCLPMAKRPMMIGLMMSIAQLGIVCGPLIGGALTQYTTWRWCFYINLPAGGLVVILLLLLKIPSKVPILDRKSRTTTVLKKLDLLGFALFAPAAIQCLLALEWGGITYPWHSATIIGLFCGSGATLFVFILWQYRRGDDAMIPLSAVRRRIVWASCLTMLFFYGALMLGVYYLPIYFQAVRGVTPTLSGVYLLPSILVQIVFAIVSGALVGKMGYYLPWLVGGGILQAIGNGLLSTLDVHTSTGKWVGYQIIMGVGRGCGLQMPIIAIQNNLPPAMISIGMALVVFTQTFGGAVFLAIGQTELNASLIKDLPKYAPNVDVHRVIEAGYTNVGKIGLDEVDFRGVVKAFSDAVDNVFYLAAAAAVMVFVMGWGTGWKDIRKNKGAADKSGATAKTEEKAMEEGKSSGGDDAEKLEEKEKSVGDGEKAKEEI